MHWLRAKSWNKSQNNPARELQMSQCTKSQEYAWCTWDQGWQAKLEKQLSTSWFSSLPTRTVRHAWTDQTLIKMSWAETPQLLLFDQHLTQGMKIGLLPQSYLWKNIGAVPDSPPWIKYILLFVSTTCVSDHGLFVSIITGCNFMKAKW